MSDPSLIERLAGLPLFATVPRPDLADLADRLVRRTFSRGQPVFRQGDLGTSLYVIESGAVKIGALSSDGREVVMALLGPGDVFGELSLFNSGLRSADATVVESGTLLSLSHDDFRPYLYRHPAVALELLAVLAGRLLESDRALQDAIFTDVPGRLARRFLDLAERHGRPVDGGTLIDLPLTQEDLAHMVGSSRESVNKAIASFVGRGWLRQLDRRYVVEAPEELRGRAG